MMDGSNNDDTVRIGLPNIISAGDLSLSSDIGILLTTSVPNCSQNNWNSWLGYLVLSFETNVSGTPNVTNM